MAFHARALHRDKRRAARMEVRLEATFREWGCATRFELVVVDLSVIGFRCETGYTLAAGDRIFITLPGLTTSGATVAWQDGITHGCRFDTALHGAVVDYIVASHRPR